MADTLPPPRLLPSGDSAVTVEFSRTIDETANRKVLALDRALAKAAISGITETIPTYRSLLVHYDPSAVDYDTLGAQLLALATQSLSLEAKTRRWRVPVHYGGEDGIDLEDAAKTLNLTPDEVVARHVAGRYRVAMIGFTPGWSYLSGLDPSLQLSRRQSPRLLTPAGKIAIGGIPSGILCLAAPSGWGGRGRAPGRAERRRRGPAGRRGPGDGGA